MPRDTDDRNDVGERAVTAPVCCGARKRDGSQCRAAPVRGKARCRMHGGGVSKDGRASGAPRGNQNALKHGLYTRAVTAERALVRDLFRAGKEAVKAGRKG